MQTVGNIGLIYASNEHDVIGDGEKMHWHIPEELKHFKEITEGHVVVMGRKTWDSIPERFRPLPNRENYVLSRSIQELPGATVVNDIEAILRLALSPEFNEKRIWVIGGGQTYSLFLPYASVIQKTTVYAGPKEGIKVFSPANAFSSWDYEPGGWMSAVDQVSQNKVALNFSTFRRGRQPVPSFK